MNKRLIKIVVLILCAGILFSLGFVIRIESIFGYIVLSAAIMQGVGAILDFLFGLPMQVGYIGPYENKEGNEDSRVMLLILGIAIACFAIWWIVYKRV